jgi:hypothetical protein
MTARAQSRDVLATMKIAFVCVAIASVALLGFAVGEGDPPAPRAEAAESSARQLVSPVMPTLSCVSGMVSSGDFEVAAPETAAEAKAWAHSPAEAVASLNLSVLAPEAGGELSLGEATSVTSADGTSRGSEYAVTDPSNAAVARVRVEDIGFGAYAVTHIERCSG